MLWRDLFVTLPSKAVDEILCCLMQILFDRTFAQCYLFLNISHFSLGKKRSKRDNHILFSPTLPEDIKNAKTVICFKNKLKTPLFLESFYILVSIKVNLIT